MTDTAHLTALHAGLSNERARLAAAKKPSEIALRQVWIAQREKEIAGEIEFLASHGIIIPTLDAIFDEMDDDELLAALAA